MSFMLQIDHQWYGSPSLLLEILEIENSMIYVFNIVFYYDIAPPSPLLLNPHFFSNIKLFISIYLSPSHLIYRFSFVFHFPPPPFTPPPPPASLSHPQKRP